MSGNSSQPTYTSTQFNQYTIAFEGSSVGCIFSGIYFVIAGTNLYLLRGTKRYRLLWFYSIVQLILTIVYIGISLFNAPSQTLGIFNITNGSPYATSPWPAIVVDVIFVLNTWISDAFLLYRCYVVCMGNKYVLAFPVLLYIVAFGSSLAFLVVSSAPGAAYSSHAVQLTGTVYWSFSTAMNICASGLISVRLWMHKQALSAAVGSPQGAFYLGYMAMTLESALLYAAFAVATLIVYTLNSPLENVFIPLLGVVQVIAPSLIIYRIIRGISFETDAFGTLKTSANMEFAQPKPRISLQVRHGTSEGSGTVQGTDTKTDRFTSDSSMHEVKHEV